MEYYIGGVPPSTTLNAHRTQKEHPMICAQVISIVINATIKNNNQVMIQCQEHINYKSV